MAFSHTHPDPVVAWELLEDHLRMVADGMPSWHGARAFANKFGAGDLGALAARWHDLGKYSTQFQEYLHASSRGVNTTGGDHSSAGAIHASNAPIANLAKCVLSFAIAGHHTGLADATDYGQAWSRRPLRDRLDANPDSLEAIARAPDAIKAAASCDLPSWAEGKLPPFALSVLCRMIFSCLIDADRLATERYCSPSRSSVRDVTHAPLAELLQVLNARLHRFATSDGSVSPIDRARARLLRACRDAGKNAPGVFTLTAPTGSGKTLSSMAFALTHAVEHGLDRVIYALPFTSVTEQTARTFRETFAALGESNVLEHHSAYDSKATRGETDADAEAELQRELAIENWDAPVIVTTNAQLLESLFASNTRRCRKLHRVARSVIVFDEAQSLPVDLLAPTLAMLRELVEHYGVSVVLCSATMPAVLRRTDFPIGLDPASVTEIVPDPPAMAAAVRRVTIRLAGALGNDPLVEQLASYRQVLTIVNTRRHAAELFDRLQSVRPDVFHLSASMCPTHRSQVVHAVRRRLEKDEPCLVVSTQVIEAGIDIDFPVVYRAIAGLDSIVQAAGRCNREGRRPIGDVIVFEPHAVEAGRIPADIEQAIASTREVLAEHADPLGLDTIEAYFRTNIWRKGGTTPPWDGPHDVRCFGGITGLLAKLQFESADKAYNIVADATESVVVPFGGEGTQLCADLLACHGFPAARRRALLRDAQPFSVSVREQALRQLQASSLVIRAESGILVLAPEAYDNNLGVRVDSVFDPARGIA